MSQPSGNVSGLGIRATEIRHSKPEPRNLDNEEGIAYMPTFTDVDETKVKEFEICPILTQHFVHPFTNHIEPTVVVKKLTKNVIMLLDT